MWDNDVLLRIIANTMLTCSVIAVLIGAGYYLMNMPGVFPLRSVRLNIAPQNVDAEQVLRVLHTEVQGNLITVDIERLRRSLEQLPWVRSVNIRREFPDRLAVQLEEHQVLARWNSNGLVNRQGEVFFADSKQVLPSFIGPEGASAEVTYQYAEFSLQLDALDLLATQLVLSARHAWQIRLSNGMLLELGREDVQQRLARFVAAYPYSLKIEGARKGTGGAVEYVDLRYRNGFAVGKQKTNSRAQREDVLSQLRHGSGRNMPHSMMNRSVISAVA
ncbi:MAG: cell division protein FtsQ/DivIB [Gallionella sp.]